MGLLSSSSDFFGLDIGTSAIRVVQMKGTRAKVLARYGALEVDSKITKSEANADQQKLAEVIKETIARSGITTPNGISRLERDCV
jgi:Tfp pilus assembly PilM family ATPase